MATPSLAFGVGGGFAPPHPPAPCLPKGGKGSMARDCQPTRSTGLGAEAPTSRTSVRPSLGTDGHPSSTIETNLSLKASIGPGSIPLGGLGLTGVGAPSAGLDGLTLADGTSNNGEVLPVSGAPFSPFAQTLDNLSYRTLGLGFPLLTIGILSGAVWANEAWGSYWSWDPKETWALITWLVFAIYLHTRLSKGWRGNKPALIAVAGFFVVWICYLGVNLLGTGLHSYGWFQARG
ncbi:probable cytochrome c biogenesis protein CcsA at C-terminar half (chloroplast) [Coccomyxa sp. Obi]|nr:probable cytochrome c biogenesis protein CcsA at C-terminar half [Coccomyxa sp. Obi]